MAAVHPKHPKCECGKALFRTPKRGMKRQSGGYVFCRNEECSHPARQLTLQGLGAVDDVSPEPEPDVDVDDDNDSGADGVNDVDKGVEDDDEGPDANPAHRPIDDSDNDSGRNASSTSRSDALNELRACVRELLPKGAETRHLWVAIALQEVGQTALASEFIKAMQLDALDR